MIVFIFEIFTGKEIRDLDEAEFSKFFSLWKEHRIYAIRDQLDQLGGSFDHHREYFTLDPELCGAVATTFIRLHDKGYIKRKKSLVLWSYAMKSTVSDVEVKMTHIKGGTKLKVPGMDEPVSFGLFHTLLYPLDSERLSGEGIKVSTMNLFTIPGDVAVAVHPDDSRYVKYHGKMLYNPASGKAIPVIADPVAKPDFGTGAVKITPSSSQTDYEVAVKHKLPIENFMNEDGSFIEESLSPEFAHLMGCNNRFEATEAVLMRLKEMNLYVGYEPRDTIVPICSRNGDIIERRIKSQWFLDTKPGYEMLKARIENGSFQVFPGKKVNILLNWLNNPQDWCISRQIPFGHQIPAYKVIRPDGEIDWIIAPSLRKATQKAKDRYDDKNLVLKQDTDVLDTWFSSALLPLSALDWPKLDSPYFKLYYPLTLMETGYDILNFWVMKMILLSTYLTGMMPFHKVHLHGMVCDARGKKMSKTLGNAIDPVDVIKGAQLSKLNDDSKSLFDSGLINKEEYENALVMRKTLFPRGIKSCGADGLRLSLYEHNPKVDAINFSVQHLERNRHLINKIWQAFRFLTLHKDRLPPNFEWFHDIEDFVINEKNLGLPDKWIISRLNDFMKQIPQDIEEFALNNIYHRFIVFWVSCLCDTYLEAIKPDGPDKPIDSFSINVLAQIYRCSFIALHPLIPHVTEELFQRLRRIIDPQKTDLKSLQLELFPDLKPLRHFCGDKLDEEMEIVRSIRSTMFGLAHDLHLKRDNNPQIRILSTQLTHPSLFDLIKKLTRCPDLSLLDEEPSQTPKEWISLHVNDDTIVLVEPKTEYFQPLLDIFIKRIESLETRLSRSSEDQEDKQHVAKKLELLTLDRDHLSQLISKPQ